MLKIVLIMLLGVLCGFAIRKSSVKTEKLSKIVAILINVLIFVLLFFLGLEVGSDKDIVSKLDILGKEALIITLFAAGGSAVFALALQTFIKKQSDKTE